MSVPKKSSKRGGKITQTAFKYVAFTNHKPCVNVSIKRYHCVIKTSIRGVCNTHCVSAICIQKISIRGVCIGVPKKGGGTKIGPYINLLNKEANNRHIAHCYNFGCSDQKRARIQNIDLLKHEGMSTKYTKVVDSLRRSKWTRRGRPSCTEEDVIHQPEVSWTSEQRANCPDTKIFIKLD